MIVLEIIGYILLALLILVLGLIALFFLVSAIPLTLDIKTKDTLTVKTKIWFVPITLTPKKEKPIKLSDFKIKRFRKKRLKEERKYLKKKILSEARAKRKTESGEINKTEKQKKSFKDSATDVVDLVNNVILKAVTKFGRGVTVKLYHFRVTVSGGEPDKTAITYGCVCQSVAYLNELLKHHAKVKYPGKTENRIYVGVDYLSGKTDVDAHIALKIRAWHIFTTGITALLSYLTMPKREQKTS